MPATTDTERVAGSLEALNAAKPAVRFVDVARVSAVADVETRRVLEELLIVSYDIRNELRVLNSNGSTQ